MSYVDQHQGPSAAGLASSVIVQLAIGAAVITGLTVSQTIIEKEDEGFVAVPLKDPPPPPPPPEKQEVIPETPVIPKPYIPPREFDFKIEEPKIDYTKIMPDPLPPLPQPGTMPKAESEPLAPVATFDPVSAKPRNNPGDWLRDRDYKSSWVRREYQGVAGFKLDIAASGKVTGCRVTSSTGHAELDEATCKLIQSRARFEPARGSNGEPVAGSFSSSVRWQLPE
ncbi:TonB family protein [Qipengyuania sp. 1NDH17]|uniref:TonB family protein n=1 Tax=Qipengyuania polymorpha TaxID=2867234 RepID=A0ABS7IWD9_9SPHN|nr:energy transducer TonB [Qipengyuania polymorpha]MBX7456687.1 TonB family protein [Qipengyuania polymorpha]